MVDRTTADRNPTPDSLSQGQATSFGRGLRVVLALAVVAVAIAWDAPPAIAEPPANDDLASATEVDVDALPFQDSLDTTEATVHDLDPNCEGRSASVWYVLRPSRSVLLEADSIGSDYDTVLSAHRLRRSTMDTVACNDDIDGSTVESRIAFRAEAGETTFVMVASAGSGDHPSPGGALVFNLRETDPPPEVQPSVQLTGHGSVNAPSGGVQIVEIEASVGCREGDFLELNGWARQTTPSGGQVEAFAFDRFPCSGERRLAVAFETHAGVFRPGVAAVEMSAFACRGPLDCASDFDFSLVGLEWRGTPADCASAQAVPQRLWPPNGNLVAVSVEGVTGAVTPELSIDRIEQDEPTGSSAASPDGFGLGEGEALLRAERSGAGGGRIYEVNFTADFVWAGVCRGTVVVEVPTSPGHTALDSGIRYDSTVTSDSAPAGPPHNHVPVAQACWVDDGAMTCGPGAATVATRVLGQLDGRGSHDPDGGRLGYSWTLASAPADSGAAIADADAALTTLFVDLPGSYVACLTVRDHQGATSPEECLSIEAQRPPLLTVQLVWDSGADLDLHLRHPNGDWFEAPWDCFWMNRHPNWGLLGSTSDDPRLDRDDTDGVGPENIVLPEPEDRVTYEVGVDFFAHDDAPETNATVRIFESGELVAQTTRPLVDGGIWVAASVTAIDGRLNVST